MYPVNMYPVSTFAVVTNIGRCSGINYEKEWLVDVVLKSTIL